MKTLLILATAVCAARPAVADEQTDVAALMGADTFAYVEAPGLSSLLGQGLEHPFLKRLLSSAAGELIVAEMGADPRDLLALADSAAGLPVLPTLSSLTEHGVAIGVGVKRGEAVWTLVARGADADRWEEALERGIHALLEQYGAPAEWAEPHANIRGADAWFLGDDLSLALREATFVASNDEGTMRDALDRLDGGAKTLAGREDFAEARRGAERGALAFAWIDLERMDSMDLEDSDLGDLRDMVRRPEVHMLLGSSFALLGQADTLTMQARLGDDGVAFKLDAHGVEASTSGALVPGAEPAPPMPKRVASESLRGLFYRDLAGVFEHRAELFPAEALPGFAKAITDLTIFFGGLDLEQDVLPKLSPWMTVVAREVDFDEGATPEIVLPAAAIVLEVEDEEVGRQLLTAFQTAVGIINIEAAQQGNPSMLVRVASEHGVEISYGQYARPHDGDGVDARYNLVPACAWTQGRFILGTHRGLVSELAGQVKRGEVERATTPKTELLRVELPPLRPFIERNAEAIVANAMLNEGKTEARARTELSGILAVMDLVGAAQARLSRAADSAYSLELDLSFAGVKR